MTNMQVLKNLTRTAAWALVAFAALTAARPAIAGSLSYSVNLCEDLSVLQNPNNAQVAANAAYKSQHTLMVQRTNPYIELRNTSTTGEQLTQFQMTIGDTSKNFDWAKMVEASPGVKVTILGPDSQAGGVKSDVFTVQFSGFDPGDFVRFRTGLSSDSPSSGIMDYRSVFFDMNGNDPSKNSQLTVTFGTGNGATSLSQQLPNFVNNNKFTATSLAVLTTNCGMDSVMPFAATGSGEPVPEPASLTLLATGLAGAIAWRRRIRRQT